MSKYDNYFNPTTNPIAGLSGDKQSVLNRQPVNQNFLYPTFFKFDLYRLPTVSYFTTKVNLPDFGFESVFEQPTRYIPVRHGPNRVAFATLEISFLVDEDMANWREIYNWIREVGVVEDNLNLNPKYGSLFSDATLMITNSAMNPNVQINFKNIFPISITGFQFDSSVTDPSPFETTATFSYDYYTVEKL